MRVGLVGAGKRMADTYARLTRALGEDVVGFTTRTPSTAVTFSAATGIADRGSILGLMQEKPDYLIVCVRSHATLTVLRQLLSVGVPILVETPIEDPTILGDVERAGATVGVLEQWPYLPLEQFKELVYASGTIKRPFLVQNDCRSFDYHAVAQLRTYIGRSKMPTQVMAQRIQARLEPFITASGELRQQELDSWELGTVTFSGGTVIQHQFSYGCKVAPFRSIQTLRAYSADGTIVTGRVFDRANDYELIDIEFLRDKVTARMDVSVSRDEWGIKTIADSVTGIAWSNPFYERSGLSDADIAVMTHLHAMQAVVHSGAGPLYPIQDAALDQHIMSAIKHACTNGPVRLQ